MAWSTPRTWYASETVTAAMMNAHVRDNLNALANRAVIVGIGSKGAGAIPTGVACYVYLPMALKFTGWSLVSTLSGSIVIDVWRDTWANFPPTVADTIAGSEKPTLSSAQNNQDLTLTTWTKDTNAGDVIAFNVDSCTTCEQVTLTLIADPR